MCKEKSEGKKERRAKERSKYIKFHQIKEYGLSIKNNINNQMERRDNENEVSVSLTVIPVSVVASTLRDLK